MTPRHATAEAHSTFDVPIATPDQSVHDVLTALQGRHLEFAGDVAICVDGRLVGLVSAEALLSANPEACMDDLMDTDPPLTTTHAHRERAIWSAIERGKGSVAVVADDGQFVGLIPPRNIIVVLQHEHEEDLARLGGYLRGTSVARKAAEERVVVRYWHKLPWLIVGLIGTFLAADIVAGFDRMLQDDVILAFFLPGVVYLADAVGTQTETLVIRGLSINIPLRRFARRELITGLMVGLTLAVMIGPLVVLRWGRTDVALAVAISLAAACSVATLVAMVLPGILQSLGRDPAYGSGPLATVVQDILSIAIYLGIAATIVD